MGLSTASETSRKEGAADPSQLRNIQGEMFKRLGVQELIDHTTISKYELDNHRSPSARLLGIPVQQIIDDEFELTL